MAKPSVSVVVPVYKPEKEVFDLFRKRLGDQTVEVEVVEKWNNPEAVSMNLGIKEAKGDIVVILAQDCVPAGRDYIEKLINPLEDPAVAVSVSDLLLDNASWKKRPFFARMFTINDLKLRKPRMNLSSCAYRRKDLIEVGLIDEEVSAIDLDFVYKIIKKGRIERSNAVVYHLHPHYNYKNVLSTFYSYSRFNGISVREYGVGVWGFLKKLIRATPILGFASVYYRYPLREKYYLLPVHFFTAGIMEHAINVLGFWHGFIGGDDGGSRNKAVLDEN